MGAPVTVVFVHGIRTSRTMWRDQIARLPDGVVAVAPDLPGHGERVAEPFTLSGAVQTVQGCVERAAGSGPVVVVGLSLGSYVSATWAASTEHRPAAVVLASCGTIPRGAGLRAYRQVARAIGRLPDRGLGLHEAMVSVLFTADLAQDVLAGGTAIDVTPDALAEIAGCDPLTELGSIPEPIWFVNGSRDHFRMQERALLRATPAATLVVIPAAGHLVALDQPAAFARVVADAIAQAD